MNERPEWLRDLGSTQAGVFVVDDRQKIVLWNKAAQELLGHREHEVLHQKCYRVIAGRNCSTVCCQPDCPVRRGIRHGALPEDFELLTHHKDGRTIWLNVSILRLSQSGGRLMLHMFHDVTHEKQAELALAAFLSTLRQDPTELDHECSPYEGDGHMLRRHLLATLTRREIEVLSFLAEGDSTEAMAGRLHISPYTVRRHIDNSIKKLGLHSKAQAIAFAYRHRLL